MSSRFPIVRTVVPLAVAGIAAMLLIPADGSTPNPVRPSLRLEPPVLVATASSENVVLSPRPLDQTTIAPAAAADTPAATRPAATAVASVAPSATAADGAPLDMPPDAMTTGSVAVVPPAEATAPAAEPEPQGRPTTVGNTAVNMRVGPSTNTARIMALQPGEPVTVMEMSDNWAFVATASGETGWVYSTYLAGGSHDTASKQDSAKDAADRPPRKKRTQTARVDGEVVIRSAPSQRADRLFVTEPGEPIQIVETRGRWARVVLDSGMTGWVRLRRAD